MFPEPGLNALWINPALASKENAAAMFGETGWINSGGIRGWISPEFETHVGDVGRFWDTYAVSPEVDPGAYRLASSDETSATLEMEMSPRFHHSQGMVPLRLRRTVSMLEAPLESLPAGVSHTGIALESELSANGDLPPGVRPGLWNLVQVSGGGEIVLPLAGESEPTALFGTPAYSTDRGVLTCPVSTDKSFKISLHADESRGFMAYLNVNGPSPILVTCRFPVLDRSLCADAPYWDLSDDGHVQQVYVDDGRFGGFGELEYHTPALEPGEREEIQDRGEVHAFSGPEAELRKLTETMVDAV